MPEKVKFLRMPTSDVVVRYLIQQIDPALKRGKTVLWLVPGGSAIPLVVKVAKSLHNTKRLLVTLTDGRYGPVGHEDSNWQQLLKAGLSAPDATLLPVLRGLNPRATAQAYEENLQNLLQKADVKIGFFGLGTDGHTAGILPHSQAVNSESLVVFYDGGSYQRLTITPPAIARLDKAVVFALGEAKRSALENLKQNLSVAEQPAQALKKAGQLTIFNDQIGGEV